MQTNRRFEMWTLFISTLLISTSCVHWGSCSTQRVRFLKRLIVDNVAIRSTEKSPLSPQLNDIWRLSIFENHRILSPSKPKEHEKDDDFYSSLTKQKREFFSSNSEVHRIEERRP